ncbi:hypothetical protein MNAN1_002270 [Malassezia nana]|uniref:ubiquitinyl hydrolase 1 n=1 Tax=Malassezia nana TaxID=180528 RepID=A0AAF0EK84_9BASI|nr:hypothetical protein MNAN1_002270 [Malassezia nana]
MSRAQAAVRLLPHIYHEKQESGSMMCAQHALNAILQGHFYDPSQLGQMAQELAEHERLELGIPDHDDYENSHVDGTGYFSVDVMERALKAWDMSLIRWRPCRHLGDRYNHPEREFAFLLNLESHWVALRGFGRQHKCWFNLNSFFDQPQWIGDAYLSTFLEQVAREKYTVFVVELEGDMRPPETIANDLAEAFSPFLHPVASSSMDGMEEDVSELDEGDSEVDDESTGPADIDDEQMQAVIAASLGHEYTISQRVLDRTHRAFRLGSSEHMVKTEQVPADVERIRRVRASQPKEELTTKPDEQASAPPQDLSAPEQMGEEEEEKPVNPTPEEMRRLRLARFG